MLPSNPDPITHINHKTRMILIASIAGGIVCLVWAITPLLSSFRDTAATPIPPSQLLETTTLPRPAPPANNWHAFEVSLWHPFPPQVSTSPPPTPPPPPPPAPNRYQLLAITADARRSLIAVVYDPSTNKLHRVRTGDNIQETRIISVNQQCIELEYSGRNSRLHLRQDGP